MRRRHDLRLLNELRPHRLMVDKLELVVRRRAEDCDEGGPVHRPLDLVRRILL
jgi:hypothetical protein